MPEWTETMEQIGKTFENMTARLEKWGPEIEATNTSNRPMAARLTVLRRIAADLDEPAETMLALGSTYAAQLIEVDAGILSLIRLAEEQVSDEDRAAACEMFESLRQLEPTSQEMVRVLEELSSEMDDFGGLSRDLRKPLSKMQQAMRNVRDGHAVIQGWIRQIDEADIECP
jgi:methyl-accepting chemotaxis protein